MLLTISFAPSPSFMVELAVPKAGSVSGVSLGVGPPRNAAVRTARGANKWYVVRRTIAVVWSNTCIDACLPAYSYGRA